MCGRFTDKIKTEKLSKTLKITSVKIPAVKKRFNIAPSQGVRAQIEDRIEILTWGLVPGWAKDPSIGHKMINARAETVDEKPSFRGPFKNSRCLIIADGFYEWKREGSSKQPFYIKVKDEEVMTFAGLWSHWTGADGSEIKSCSIITTSPNDFMAPIHNRMPVILPAEKRAKWLDTANHDKARLKALLQPYAEAMEAFPVSSLVNNPRNDVPECITPLN